MEAVIWKAVAFLFVIFLSYFLNRRGFFPAGSAQTVTKITMNITMPAAVISSFAQFQKDNSLFLLVALGLGCNCAMLLAGFLVSRKMSRVRQVYYLMNFPGYNIGSFTLPFVQNFLGPYGVVATCLFDTGNSIMCTGGTYAIVSGIVGGDGGSRLTAKDILKRLFSSVPFDTYLLMLILVLTGIPIPGPVNTVASTIGAANGFMAMMMLGMMFRFEAKAAYFKDAGFTLLVRYLFAGALSALFYFCTPLPLELRQVLAIIVFAPNSALSAAFTEKNKGDSGLSSFTGTISLLLSIVIMTVLLLFMNIS